MQTDQLYAFDSYIKQCSATVLAVAANEVALSETPFYPGGGGHALVAFVDDGSALKHLGLVRALDDLFSDFAEEGDDLVADEIDVAEAAATLRVQYGGSVKADSAPGLMAMADIDGALVGGASLEAEAFAGIVQYRLAETTACGVEMQGAVFATGYSDTLSLIRDGERGLETAAAAAEQPRALAHDVHSQGRFAQQQQGAIDQRGDRERALSSVRLRYVHPTRRARPVGAAVDPTEQVFEVRSEILSVGLPRHPVDPRCSLRVDRHIGRPKASEIDVVQQRREPCLLVSSCYLAHTTQPA